MKLPEFILDRTDDCLSLSRWRMAGVALLYYIGFYVVFVLLLIVCLSVYNAFGISPDEMTSFGGNPTYLKGRVGTHRLLLTAFIVAPLCEELIFRLGISMRRKAVALWAGLFPAVFVWYFVSKAFMPVALALEFGLLMAAAVWFFTDDGMWEEAGTKYLKPVVWLSAVAFGLVHLNAFSELSWILLPYALCMTVMPFFGGCIITYVRMNMGFLAGLLAHILFNVPSVLGAILMSL